MAPDRDAEPDTFRHTTATPKTMVRRWRQLRRGRYRDASSRPLSMPRSPRRGCWRDRGGSTPPDAAPFAVVGGQGGMARGGHRLGAARLGEAGAVAAREPCRQARGVSWHLRAWNTG